MASNIGTWLRQHTLGVSGYIGASGYLAQIKPTLNNLGAFVGTLANINVILATLIAAVTLAIKGFELYSKVNRRKKEKANETDGDSQGLG